MDMFMKQKVTLITAIVMTVVAGAFILVTGLFWYLSNMLAVSMLVPVTAVALAVAEQAWWNWRYLRRVHGKQTKS